VTIHPPARLVGELKKKKERKEERKKERHPKQWQTGYSPRPPTLSDQNQTLLCTTVGLHAVIKILYVILTALPHYLTKWCCKDQGFLFFYKNTEYFS